MGNKAISGLGRQHTRSQGTEGAPNSVVSTKFRVGLTSGGGTTMVGGASTKY